MDNIYTILISNITAVIVAFIGGGAFKAIIDYLLDKYKSTRKNNFQTLFENIHFIYSTLNNIKRISKARRVLILRAENGGGIPTVGSELYSTILYEAYDDPFRSSKNDWQKQRLQEEHLMILKTMYMDGSKIIKSKDLKKGDLKDFFESHGVHSSEMHYIAESKNHMYYMDLHFHDSYYADYRHRNIIRTSINKLKPLFENKE